MTTIEHVQQQFAHLRYKVNQGELFLHLGDEMSALVRQVERQIEVPVYVSGEYEVEAQQIFDTLGPKILQQNQPATEEQLFITDDQLAIVLQQLTSRNPELRDRGAFFFLGDVIQQQGLTARQLYWITDYLSADEQLFLGILAPENDYVYQRAFAVLILSLTVLAHRTTTPFLDDRLIQQLLNQTAVYAALERDTRGFIGTNGWAHAFTHIGNLVHELTALPQLARADKVYVLAAVLTGYRDLATPLVMGETERLVGIVVSLTSRHQIYADYVLRTLKVWRQDIVTPLPPHSEQEWHRIYNRMRFFQAILLRGDEVPEAIREYVVSTKDYLI
jgi:hypothetical protein